MNLNIAHSEFPEQKRGLMICGYEWGFSRKDEGLEQSDTAQTPTDAVCTFTNKNLRYGPQALKWPYDSAIRKWFEMWGHPLSQSVQTSFERSIIQTNWCDTQSNNMAGDYGRLKQAENVQNFLSHVEHFDPEIILFMGSQLINALNDLDILSQFEKFAGPCIQSPLIVQKDFSGIRFKVTFQSFKRCQIVSLPHPSSSRGLSDAYIAMYRPEMDSILQDYKQHHLSKTP